MSEVYGETAQVTHEVTVTAPKDLPLDAVPCHDAVDPGSSPSGKIPVLRVEQIKGEEGCSSANTSEDDCHSGLSDAETGTGKRDLGPFVEPSEELQEKITSQVEFYFSDANILKDAFLLKHVRRNKQGFVSIKLITSFKKVKSLTKDYRQVALTLRQSSVLSVNEEGTKVRRNEPLPEYDETCSSRTVVAINLPFDSPSIENISGLFSKYGDIALVRIIRPGKNVPTDIKKHLGKHPTLGTCVCAVVEFEDNASARKACTELTYRDNWRDGLNVVLLAQPKRKNDKNREAQHSDNETGEKNKRPPRGGKKNRMIQLSATNDHSSGSETEDDPKHRNENEKNGGRLSSDRNSVSPNRLSAPRYLSPSSSPKSSPHSSPSSSPVMRRRAGSHGKSPLAADGSRQRSPDGRAKSEDGSGDSAPSSPWVQRRLKAAQELSPLAKNGSPNSSPQLGRRSDNGPRIVVVRQPKGPDGSTGFSVIRKRLQPVA